MPERYPHTGDPDLLAVDAMPRRTLRRMQLTDTERQSAAQACRIAAYQAEQDAAKQSNPSVRATFEATARRYLDLAAKLAAGKSRDSR